VACARQKQKVEEVFSKDDHGNNMLLLSIVHSSCVIDSHRTGWGHGTLMLSDPDGDLRVACLTAFFFVTDHFKAYTSMH
jgi:hypothetical protein